MGFYKFAALIIALALIVMPLAAIKSQENYTQESGEKSVGQGGESEGDSAETVKVFMSDDDLVLTITLEEYLTGVLAAEMLPTYHEQALKAQAVAAYTYLLHKKSEQESSPDSNLRGAYLSNDAATHQGYLTKEERAEKWGDKAESYEKKLKKAVEDVAGRYIVYDGKPIIAAFHANNSGITHSAETVWGGDVPYLKSVTSIGDKLSPDCLKTVAITAQEFSSAVTLLEGCQLSGEAEGWVGAVKRNDNGYVKTMEIGGAEFTGLEVRDALGLRSAVFTFEFSDGTFRFTTEGYGHGVGMSQYGADYMARQGSSWEEILKHYYTGVEIK